MEITLWAQTNMDNYALTLKVKMYTLRVHSMLKKKSLQPLKLHESLVMYCMSMEVPMHVVGTTLDNLAMELRMMRFWPQ